MSLFITFAEMSASAFTGAGLLYFTTFRKKVKKHIPDIYGAIPWMYERISEYNYGFRCIKCGARNKNRVQPPICQCEEYPNHHFHFKCNDCGFSCIMRTRDVE